MNDSLDQLAHLTAEYMNVFEDGAKTKQADPLVVACLGLSNLTLDLVWALQWIDTMTDRLGEDGMVAEFMADLKKRSEQSPSLKVAAREANLP